MKLILNADDYGGSATINEATCIGFREGWVNRATIMINKSAAEEATVLASSEGYFNRIGLHVNLSTGTPVTEEIKSCSKLCGEDGDFHGKIFRGSRIPFILTNGEKHAVRAEIKAQMEMYLDFGYTLLHLDSHGHIHTFPAIQPIVMNLAKHMKFTSIRISMNIGPAPIKQVYKYIQNIIINRHNGKNGVACDYFTDYHHIKKYLLQLPCNCTTEIMLHPDIRNGICYIDREHTSSEIKEWLAYSKAIIGNKLT